MRRTRLGPNRAQRKSGKKGRSSRSTKNKPVAPRTSEQFSAKSAKFQDRWTRMTHVIAKMRSRGVSLRQASREFGLDPRTTLRLGGSALRKRSNGRYAAKPRDRLLRVIRVPTRKGPRPIAMRDSRQATEVAEYWNAVDRYLESGDDRALRKFHRKRITDATGTRVPLLTDLDELDRLGNAGVLSFESLYSKVG